MWGCCRRRSRPTSSSTSRPGDSNRPEKTGTHDISAARRPSTTFSVCIRRNGVGFTTYPSGLMDARQSTRRQPNSSAGELPSLARPDDLDEPGGGYGLRFLDPENRCIELSAGVAEHPNGGSAVGKSAPAGCAMWVSTLGGSSRSWRSTLIFSGFGSRTGLRTRWSSCDATGDITSLSSLVRIIHRSTMLRT